MDAAQRPLFLLVALIVLSASACGRQFTAVGAKGEGQTSTFAVEPNTLKPIRFEVPAYAQVEHIQKWRTSNVVSYDVQMKGDVPRNVRGQLVVVLLLSDPGDHRRAALFVANLGEEAYNSNPPIAPSKAGLVRLPGFAKLTDGKLRVTGKTVSLIFPVQQVNRDLRATAAASFFLPARLKGKSIAGGIGVQPASILDMRPQSRGESILLPALVP